MSSNGGAAGAGWFHAEGDPPGTQRYWNGSAWQGEPQPVAPAQPATPAPPAYSPPPAFGPPGGPGPQPAFGGPVLSEPKKKSNWWKWLLGIGLVLVLGIGGCSYALFRAASGPIDVGNEFLAAVQADDFDGAWALSDPSCFELDGPDDLRNFFAGEQIESYRLSGTSVSSINGVTTGSTTGTVTLSGSDVRSIDIFANRVGDNWRVCGFDIGAPGSG